MSTFSDYESGSAEPASLFSVAEQRYDLSSRAAVDLPLYVSRTSAEHFRLKPEYAGNPVIELRYTLSDVKLTQVLGAFKSMVFDDSDALPSLFEKQRKMSKRIDVTSSKTRALPLQAPEIGEKSEFSETSKKSDSCEHAFDEWFFDVTLMPLMQSKEDIEEVKEQALADESSGVVLASASEATHTGEKPEMTAAESAKKFSDRLEVEAKDTDESWSYLGSAWSAMSSAASAVTGTVSAAAEWATTGWSESVNALASLLGMLLNAQENWQINWSACDAISVVENETMRTVIGVDEYSQLVEKDDSVSAPKTGKSVLFVKRLYISSMMTVSQLFIDAMVAQYKEDSDFQMEVILELIHDPSLASIERAVTY
jgi:hypothetical protein